MARPVKIPAHLHARLAELDLCGWSSVQLQIWLAATYQLDAASETICKILQRVRITPPSTTPPAGSPTLSPPERRCEPICWLLIGGRARARSRASSRSASLALEIEERRATRVYTYKDLHHRRIPRYLA